jgi:hypothetical protein
MPVLDAKLREEPLRTRRFRPVSSTRSAWLARSAAISASMAWIASRGRSAAATQSRDPRSAIWAVAADDVVRLHLRIRSFSQEVVTDHNQDTPLSPPVDPSENSPCASNKDFEQLVDIGL